MLTIRDEQFFVIATPALDRFVARLLLTFPDVFPGDERLLDAGAMDARVRAAVQYAVEFEIRDAQSLALFVFLYHEHGPSFADAAATRWMGPVLRDRRLDSRSKMSLIYTRLAALHSPPA